jgi:hypothetical protein
MTIMNVNLKALGSNPFGYTSHTDGGIVGHDFQLHITCGAKINVKK